MLRKGHGRRDKSECAAVKGVERHSGGAVVVHLEGELDLYNAPEVRTALLELASEQPERLVVDLAEVAFVDSTALGVLIEARATPSQAGRRSYWPRPARRLTARSRSPASTGTSACTIRSKRRLPPRSNPDRVAEQAFERGVEGERVAQLLVRPVGIRSGRGALDRADQMFFAVCSSGTNSTSWAR